MHKYYRYKYITLYNKNMYFKKCLNIDIIKIQYILVFFVLPSSKNIDTISILYINTIYIINKN